METSYGATMMILLQEKIFRLLETDKKTQEKSRKSAFLFSKNRFCLEGKECVCCLSCLCSVLNIHKFFFCLLFNSDGIHALPRHLRV